MAIALEGEMKYACREQEIINMTNITVQLEEAKAEALRKKAERFGLNLEQLLVASIEDLIGQPDTDFEEAARRVLSKNQELYRRLA